jgi:hypothetical protein
MKYFYPGVRVDFDGVDFNKSMVNRPEIEQVSDTAIKITVETMNMDTEPSYYVVSYKDVSSGVTTIVSPNPTESPFYINGLVRTKKYDIEIKAVFEELDPSEQPDPLKIFSYVMDEELAGSSLIGNSTDPKDINSNFYKGYLTLSSKVADDKKYTVATRSFSAIKVPQSTQGLLPGGKNSAPKYPSGENANYFAFGTSLKFAADIENGLSGGGIGFFTDDRANKGYYLLIETTSSASSVGRKAIRWVKIQKGKDGVEKLAETFQTAIYAGQIYNVDIRVKLDGFNITMIAYVNGVMLRASDKTYYNTGTKKVSKLVAPTDKITLICSRGKVHYDYVYGRSTDSKYYSDTSSITNKYYGQYSEDFISSAFGELTFNENEPPKIDGEYVDEFGTVVREIRKYDVKFNNSPAIPIGWDAGINSAASILSQDWNNFTSTAWVLNNSSTTIPVTDGETTQLHLYGNKLSSSSQLIYTTGDEKDYGVKRPIVFETKWIQRSEDAKSLGDWIKDKVINKGRVIKMEIFGNPLIQIGDIISVKYDYQNFTGEEPLIVTNIRHTFNAGLKTNITCRTI